MSQLSGCSARKGKQHSSVAAAASEAWGHEKGSAVRQPESQDLLHCCCPQSFTSIAVNHLYHPGTQRQARPLPASQSLPRTPALSQEGL